MTDPAARRYWFKARWLGWGWYPATKEGWAVTFLYVILVVLFALTIDEASPPREVAFTFVLPVLLITITFIRIAYLTGETPRWRWAGRDVSPQTARWLWVLTAGVVLFAIGSAVAGVLLGATVR